MKSIRIGCELLLFAGSSWAQQYVISTVAGGAPPPTHVAAVSASAVWFPQGVTADAAGNVYFTSLNCVFKVDKNGILTLFAGTSRAGYSGDGADATSAQLFNPVGVAVDAGGNLYTADTNNNRVRRISAGGTITTVAGNGSSGFAGDGGSAASAGLYFPNGVAVDIAGNLYIADTNNNRVRKVAPDGTITTVAGSGSPGFGGDGGPATSAQLYSPYGVAVDGVGNLYISDTGNYRVRKVSQSGVITTVAGNGSSGLSGDGGLAIIAQLSSPQGVAVDAAGNLYVADFYSARVRKVSPDGIITTAVGGGTASLGDGGAATSAQVAEPEGVAVDGVGNVYVVDLGDARVRKVSPDGIITTVAGNGTCCFSGDGGPASTAQLSGMQGVAVDHQGLVYIADTNNYRVRKVSPGGIITTVAGNGSIGRLGDGGPATSAQLSITRGVAADAAGSLYIADDSSRIRWVSPNGIITTVAGNGSRGFSGDGGPAISAQLNGPTSVTVDTGGNLYLADWGNSRVRRVSQSGTITTVAGFGIDPGYSGDGGPATSGQLNQPFGVAVDSTGNLYIADSGNNRVRKVSLSGVITTVAGNGSPGFSGDNGPATSAQLNDPLGVAVDSAGNLYIADARNNRVRRVSPSGIITTVAGNGLAGYSGDNGAATSGQLSTPFSVAVDSAGDIYVADTGNSAVRLLTPTSQAVLISAVLDAGSERATAISPGKILVIYGAGLGPSQLAQNQPTNGVFSTQLSDTAVSINGTPAPILYTSATQVAAIAPYEISGASAQVTVAYQGQVSSAFSVPVAASAPSLFSYNQTGAGQAAAINNVDGTINSATNPVKIGSYIQLYLTGEGQTVPAGVDGRLGGSVATHPNLAVTATVGGISATVQYAGGVFGDVAGLMQVNVLIPVGVQPGGYVPVVVQVGNASTVNGAAWIAVSGN